MLPKPWEVEPTEKPEWLKLMPPPKPPAPGASLTGNGRKKPGRPRAIPDAHALIEAAEAYMKWAEENPIKKQRTQLYEGKPVTWYEETPRPLTRTGFRAFLGISERTLYRLLHDEQNPQPEIAETAEAIFQVFDSELLEGGVTKLYDGSMISRILSIADTVNTTNTTPAAPPAPPVASENEAIHVHPDDPDPLNPPRPLYSRAQIDAGIPFHDLLEHKRSDVST